MERAFGPFFFMDNIYNFTYLYLFIGLMSSLFIILYPYVYVNSLKEAILILKTASFKLQAKEKKEELTPQKLAQKQEDYEAEFEAKIIKDSDEIQKSKLKFNITLVFMILGWPLIAFIYILAFLLKYLYLDSQDLP